MDVVGPMTGGSAVTEAGTEMQFATDEAAHVLVIGGPGVAHRRIGGPGAGPGEFRYPRGLCVLGAGPDGATRVFVCDSWNHRIQVFDDEGRFQCAFGASGTGSGQFDVPSDVCLVTPRFGGEDADAAGPLLAVADRWNCRVQVFTLDGVALGSVGRRAGDAPAARTVNVSRAGWPHFHTGAQPVLSFPTRLHWRAPWLDVTCAGDRIVSIDLAAALLPDFASWVTTASEHELACARHDLAPATSDDLQVTPETLAAIDAAIRGARVPLRVAS